MSKKSELEEELRRIVQMRERSVSADVIETEVELAKALWREVQSGGPVSWAEELEPIATELGFVPDAPAPGPSDSFFGRLDGAIDDALDEQIGVERKLYQLAATIEREIQGSVTGLMELHVAAVGSTVQITGSAHDETAKSRAGAVAAGLVPAGITVDNQLVVEW